MERFSWTNIFRLGLKELRSLAADKVLLGLIVWAFSGAIYEAATGSSQQVNNAPVAIVDEDASPLSTQLVGALYPPYFRPPERIALDQVDAAMNAGKYAFVLVIPANFQRDVAAGRQPEIQLDIDATLVSQAFIGASYITQIVNGEVNEYLTGRREDAATPVRLTTRARFNPNLTGLWFGGVMEAINNVTMLTIILVGAAFIREREHGTIEHLLVMPLTPFEIMMAKIWANGLAVLIGVAFALLVMVQRVLQVPIAGSLPLFLGAAALYLFSAASIGIFLGTVARSMPQLGLLVMLVVLPLEVLSGGMTPRESMPGVVQFLMEGAPTTHFVALSQAILYRGAGFSVVWPQFAALAVIGTVLFLLSLARFRKTLGTMA